MNRLLRENIRQNDKWSRQDHILIAHKWEKLADNENRWAVYPNVPRKVFQFDNWNPIWQDAHGK